MRPNQILTCLPKIYDIIASTRTCATELQTHGCCVDSTSTTIPRHIRVAVDLTTTQQRSLRRDGRRTRQRPDITRPHTWTLDHLCHERRTTIYLYDSLQKTSKSKLTTTVMTSINNMYGTQNDYIASDITQQTGHVDCGLFSIAYLTSLCHGQNPDGFRMQQSEMRHHLLECFESEQLSPFPATKKRSRNAPSRYNIK